MPTQLPEIMNINIHLQSTGYYPYTNQQLQAFSYTQNMIGSRNVTYLYCYAVTTTSWDNYLPNHLFNSSYCETPWYEATTSSNQFTISDLLGNGYYNIAVEAENITYDVKLNAHVHTSSNEYDFMNLTNYGVPDTPTLSLAFIDNNTVQLNWQTEAYDGYVPSNIYGGFETGDYQACNWENSLKAVCPDITLQRSTDSINWVDMPSIYVTNAGIYYNNNVVSDCGTDCYTVVPTNDSFWYIDTIQNTTGYYYRLKTANNGGLYT